MKKAQRMLPQGYRLADWLLTGAAPLGLIWLLEGFSRGSAGAVPAWAYAQPGLFLMNYALYAAPCLLLCLFPSRRVRVSCVLTLGLLCALLGIVNRYKMFYRMEPILFTDISQLSDAREAAAGLSLDIDFAQIWWVLGGFAALFAAGIILVRGRARSGAVLPLLGAALLVAMPPLCTFSMAGGGARYDMVDQARTDGTLYAAIAMENHRRALMRVDYDESGVRAQYRALMQETPAAEAREAPNIIVVLSESFADEAWLGQYLDLEFELMPFYNRLVETCRHGRIYVPKLGGGTSETEFEVLTGLRSQYAVNPYSLGLPPMSSLASMLRDRGYESTAIHWYTGVYYNRYNNLRMLGFDSFYTTDTMRTAFEKKGMFVSDEEHYRAILNQLSQTPERDFIFCLTMQNHGGYDYDDFCLTYGAQTPFTNELSERATTILTNYCWLLEQSDSALEGFLTALEEVGEPTVVVFFSDHIPPFGTDVYEELGVPTAGDAGHLTPYFIWSNTGNESGETNLYAWQLGAYALTLAGVNDDPFLAYVERLRQASGEVSPDELTGDIGSDAAYDLLSYDALFGQQYAYDEGGLSPENEDFQIGGRMTLEGFDAAEVAGAVYLRPKLAIEGQAWKLEVNGAQRDVSCVEADQGELTLRCVMVGGDGKLLNQSNAITCQSAQELLEESGKLPLETWPLWESDYEPAGDAWYQACRIYKSVDTFPVLGGTALTADGGRWQWQPTYGLSRAGQYAVDDEGHVWLAVEKNVDGETLKAQLKAWEMTLYTFEN